MEQKRCTQCKKLPKKGYQLAIDLSFGYGSKRDTEHYEFCSDECFEKWAAKNVTLKEINKSFATGMKHLERIRKETDEAFRPLRESLNKLRRMGPPGVFF